MQAEMGTGAPKGIIRRHLEGGYSLSRSFWLHYFLPQKFLDALGLFLPAVLDVLGPPSRFASTANISGTLVSTLLWAWAIIGTWVSANKHRSRGGRPFWARATKAALVLAVLGNLLLFLFGAKELGEHLEIALGRQPWPAFELALSGDGRAIFVGGGMNDGAADALERALELAPAVETVVLNSKGGWRREGILVARLIARRRLSTYVDGECSSACTIAFLRGLDRAASPRARIGFHRFRTTDFRESVEFQVRGAYEGTPIATEFIDRVLEVPRDGMWYPTIAEMEEANVVTRRSEGGEAATMSTWFRSRSKLAEALKRHRVFSSIAAKFPDEFDVIVDVAWAEVEERSTDAEIRDALKEEFADFFMSLVEDAPDHLFLEIFDWVTDQLLAIIENDPSACVALSEGELDPDLLSKRMPGFRPGWILELVESAEPTHGMRADSGALGLVGDSAPIEQPRSAEWEVAPATDPCDAFIANLRWIQGLPESERVSFFRESLEF